MKFKDRQKKILYDDWNFIGTWRVINSNKESFYSKSYNFFINTVDLTKPKTLSNLLCK